MTKSYLVVCYQKILNPDKLRTYAQLAPKAMLPRGAKILARDGQVRAFEDGLAERTVIVEFPSFDEAVEAYNSKEYQAAVTALGDGAIRDVRIVEGIE